MSKLAPWVIERLKSDPELFYKVCIEMKIKPVSLAANIGRNAATLNRYNVVMVIASHLNTDPDSLLIINKKEEEKL